MDKITAEQVTHLVLRLESLRKDLDVVANKERYLILYSSEHPNIYQSNTLNEILRDVNNRIPALIEAEIKKTEEKIKSL